jgi:hypothetical protein
VDEPPPASSKDYQKWWDEVTDHSGLDFLRVLCEVSEVHRNQGTTATYYTHFQGRTMVGWYYYQARYPVPLPERAVERIKTRLGQEKIETQSFDHEWQPLAEGGRGCSPQQAEIIWRQAKQKFAGKD